MEVWKRKEIIGDLAALCLHMARLAQANKVFNGIGQFYRIKSSKRHNMMNGEGFSDMLITMRAMPILIANHSRPNFLPTLSTIGCNSTNITRGVFPFEYTRGLETIAGAKARRSVLFFKPRLLIKNIRTVLAFYFFPLLPVGAFFANIASHKGIGWAFSCSKLITNHVFLCSSIERLSSSYTPTTRERTIARFSSPIRLHAINFFTFLTSKLYHFMSIAHLAFGSMENRTTEIASR